MRGVVVMTETKVVEQFRETFEAPDGKVFGIHGLRELAHVFRVLSISRQQMEELLVGSPEVALDNAAKARLRRWTFVDDDLVNERKSFEGFTAKFLPPIDHEV